MHNYLITCTANGKVYTGATTRNNLNRYFRQKMSDALTRNKSKRIPLYNAFRKYGVGSFVCESLFQPKTKKQMFDMEKALIKLLGCRNRDTGYNVTAGGEGAHGVKLSASRRLEISKFMTGKKYALGIKRSDEQKEGMRQRMIGNTYGKRKPTHPRHIAALKANSFANKTKEELAVIVQKSYEARKKVGWIVTEEHKHKISIATKGKKKTAETRARMHDSFLSRTTPEERIAMSAAANKARSEKLSPEERSRLAKIGSDAALAKLGPYVPKEQPKEKRCRMCETVKPIEEMTRSWVKSKRSPELGRWHYQTMCKVCHLAYKRNKLSSVA